MIAPHCTQFDGVTWSSIVSAGGELVVEDLVHLRRAHRDPGLGDLARHLRLEPDVVGRVVRVAFPDAKTDESLSKMYLLSGLG